MRSAHGYELVRMRSAHGKDGSELYFGNIYPTGAPTGGAAVAAQPTNPAGAQLAASAAYNVGGSGSITASGMGASVWIALAVIGALLLLNGKAG